MPETTPPDATARLLITCPDRPGIVAAVTSFLFQHNVNITTLDQYSTDPEGGAFFMRLEFQTPHLDVSRAMLEQAFQGVVAERFGMRWFVSYAAEVKKTAILVSRHGHAMMELLWLWKVGKLPTDITMVISNHPDLEPEVANFGIPFYHVPVSGKAKGGGAKEGGEEAEARMLELMEGRADLVVLARYMQVLSGDFVSQRPRGIINIHHSFLPAFKGADPYRQAKERGVKLIGATAHYVVEELDAGPIIDQDVARITHRHSVEAIKDLGRDLERRVLARAVRWHLEDRILVFDHRTIIFW